MATEGQMNVPRRYRATGPHETRQLIAKIRTAFPDAKFALQQRIEDDKGGVAFVWSVRGTHSGEVDGYSPTGAPATMTIVTSAITAPSGAR
ncbi:SnoaL-like polyketide cyclase [Streptomyces sp. 1114.5]|uniref:ester cyclase n=1 Tax=Streptomyces sp. 1114.5 TaxID=1938830 RepID=UPI000F28D003|nr:ester cyclase [Streptomyces sp. 1114.5]RKT09846.1 SnoaL-like polyketide cyclase [Streptomyces sp. 1114.5]